MLDGYNREINYLRISVTDRCNLRCRYCMPEKGIQSIGHSNMLTFEQIVRIVKAATQVGIRKVRFTGGEPLIRRGITRLIAEVARNPLVDDIAISTNGVLFAQMAEELKAAGLARVNFSLDSLNPERFHYITRYGKLENVLSSISKAISLEMTPVKINTVIIKRFNDDEILNFAKLAYSMPLHVRFIELMPIGNLAFSSHGELISALEIKQTIERYYKLYMGATPIGGGPAKYYQIKGGAGTIGFISAMSNHFCSMCNRIRLTADGKLRSCLFDKQEIDIKPALANEYDDWSITTLFRRAIQCKPFCHHLNDGWGLENERKMYQIGG